MGWSRVAKRLRTRGGFGVLDQRIQLPGDAAVRTLRLALDWGRTVEGDAGTFFPRRLPELKVLDQSPGGHDADPVLAARTIARVDDDGASHAPGSRG